MESNDIALLQTIVNYCDEIDNGTKRFSITAQTIESDAAHRALLAFFVLQIGEMAKRLSDSFTSQHPEIPWRAIKGFRNNLAHSYGRVIPEILWDTVKTDIPELREVCAVALAQQGIPEL